MKINGKFLLTAGLGASLVLSLSACGSSDEAAETPALDIAAETPALDIAAVPDALFAAGIECRDPNIREYKVWETPYRQLTCIGSTPGYDWIVDVRTFGSPPVLYGALNLYCGGKETTSSGSFPPFSEAAVGPNWIAWTETFVEASPEKPTPSELAAALGGGTVVNSVEEVCAIAADNVPAGG